MSHDDGHWVSLGSALGPVFARLATERGRFSEQVHARAHGADAPHQPDATDEGLRGAERIAGGDAAPHGGDGSCGRTPVSADLPSVKDTLREIRNEITATNRALIAAADAMTTNVPSVMTHDPLWDAQMTHYNQLHARLLELKILRASIEGLLP